MDLTFLNTISLTKTEAKRTRTASQETTPAEGASLRVFADGRVFPSAQFTQDNSLEYVAKDEKVGNGLDVIDTEHFGNYPREATRILMVSLGSKDEPKIDLFKSVGYDDQGKPRSSVLTQGSKSFGIILLEMVEEVYGIVTKDGYLDLVISTEHGLTTPNDIYLLPTKVARGDKKGQLDFKRRTNTILWPLTVLEVATDNSVKETTTENTTTEEAPAAFVAEVPVQSVQDQLLESAGPGDSVDPDETKDSSKNSDDAVAAFMAESGNDNVLATDSGKTDNSVDQEGDVNPGS